MFYIITAIIMRVLKERKKNLGRRDEHEHLYFSEAEKRLHEEQEQHIVKNNNRYFTPPQRTESH